MKVKEFQENNLVESIYLIYFFNKSDLSLLFDIFYFSLTKIDNFNLKIVINNTNKTSEIIEDNLINLQFVIILLVNCNFKIFYFKNKSDFYNN